MHRPPVAPHRPPARRRRRLGRGVAAAFVCALLTLAHAAAPAAAEDAPAADDAPAPAAAPAGEAPLPAVITDALPAGADPEATADRAIAEWLARTPPALGDLVGLDTAQLCAVLPELVLAPPPPAGTRVNVDNRLPVPSAEPDRRSYTYSAVRPVDRLDVVQVDLVRDGDEWQVVRVGFRADTATAGRPWLANPVTGLVFLLLSLALVAMLFRPSPLRRSLSRALGFIREHRRLVIGTVTLLYLAFGLGVLSGSALPDECEAAVMIVLDQALGQVGATPALLAGDPLRLAVTIFFQNFGVVALLLFWLGLLFGVPAYLLAVPQFFANGLPFGVLYQAAGPLALLGTLVLIAIELTAYFLVVAGGGMLLATIVRQGFGAFGLALAKIGHMLLVAAVLLVLGAWYEVGLILLP